MEELRFLVDCRNGETDRKSDILALCLSTRRNMCIHPAIKKEVERTTVDRMCRMKTAEWVRIKYESEGGVKDIEDIAEESELWKYYEGYMRSTDDILLTKGIYSLDDLKEFGEKKNVRVFWILGLLWWCFWS